MMRSGNPALGAETFRGLAPSYSDDAMSIQGTVNKSFILLFLLGMAAVPTWNLALSKNPLVMLLMLAGGIGGFIIALVTMFKKTWAPVTAPLYAIAEGLLLGGVSSLFEGMYSFIVIQAVGITICVFAALLLAYTSKLIRATENFKLGLFAATGGVAMLYLFTFLLGLFGIRMPFLHDSGLIGIGISLVIVVIAALNLVMDFDFIENGADARAPKYMEWYGAFGLLVTLIWLYMEILHLLAKLRSRN